MSRHVSSQIVAMVAVLLAMAFVLALPAQATVYDDVAAWWHCDYDVGGDNLVTDILEIRDQRDWREALTPGANGKHATSLHGSLEWAGAAGARPAGGQEYGGRSLLFTPDVNAATNVIPDAFRVNDLNLTGSASLVTRFRFDGYATTLQNAGWLYNNALDWGNQEGWMLGVFGADQHLELLYGQTWHDSTFVVTIGTWYDVAVVITENGANDTVEFYLWAEDGDLQYQSISSSSIGLLAGGTGALVGGESSPAGYDGGNGRKCFKGAVNHLAVWDRALSFDEVNHAFGFPQPVFKLGIDNVFNTDLRRENEVDANYTMGEPWHEMRRAVTVGATNADVTFSLTADQAALDYIFHLESAGTQSGMSADIAVYVNGHDLGMQTLGQNQDYEWNVYDDVLVAAVNTLSIRYEAGPSAWLSWDWMELAGSWQVGIDNGTQGEFRQEDGQANYKDNFFVTNEELDDCERALTAGDTYIRVHFALSAVMAANRRYTYTSRIVGQGQGPRPFEVLANGILLNSYAPQPNGTPISLELGSAQLQAGDNEITLHYLGADGWTQFDFHRLRVGAIPPEGTIFIVR